MPQWISGVMRCLARGGPGCALAVLMWLLPAAAGAAGSFYRIDQRFGTVGFSVSTLGMFDVQGSFPQFHGQLVLDAAHPEQTRIDVAIDAGAVEMPLADQVALLRSPAYLDVAQYPQLHFMSSAIQALSPSHFRILGTMQIRGVTQPQELDAVLQDHRTDSANGTEVADMVVTGELKRSAFGMVADQVLLSDTVQLRIRIRLTVAPAAHGG